MSISKPSAMPAIPTALLWVRSEGGRQRIRWVPVSAYIATFTAVHLLAVVAVSWYTKAPLTLATVVATECGALAYLLVAIERQRQFLATGKWRPHLSLRALLGLMLLACIFVGAISNHARAARKAFAQNQQLAAELETVLGGGRASVGTLHGTDISCHATRSTFNDADLARVIRLASTRTGECELTMLLLEQTSITSTGVAELSACRKLTFLAIPPLTLTDKAVQAICQNSAFEQLLLDEAKLLPHQRAALHRALPKLRINGNLCIEEGP